MSIIDINAEITFRILIVGGNTFFVPRGQTVEKTLNLIFDNIFEEGDD